MALRWQTLGDVHPQAWSDLVRAISDVDGTGEYYSAEDLAEELTDDGVDVATDTIAVLDGDELIGYGQLQVPDSPVNGKASVRIMGGVHPAHRGRGIGRELFARQEDVARRRGGDRHPGLPVRLTGYADIAVASHVALLEHRGLRPVRYFSNMDRPLDAADAALPIDPRARPYDPALGETVRLAHLTAFAAQWGHAPPSPIEWQQSRVGSRTFRSAQSFVLSAEDSTRVDGYVLSYEYEPEEIYVGQVGVVPSARRHGLASAGLRAAIAAAARAGYQRIALDVDSANPDGAGRLYERLGFRTVHKTAVFWPADEPRSAPDL